MLMPPASIDDLGNITIKFYAGTVGDTGEMKTGFAPGPALSGKAKKVGHLAHILLTPAPHLIRDARTRN